MNNSTLKKTVVLSFVSLMIVGMASAQTDTTKSTKPMAMSDSTSAPKLFGGAKQYSTWTVGIDLGITNTHLATGGTSRFYNNALSFGGGVSLADQLSHAFALQADLQLGNVKGDNSKGNAGLSSPYGYSKYSTNYFSGTISGVVNIGSISFLHRTNNVNFYGSFGVGFNSYKPTFTNANSPAQLNALFNITTPTYVNATLNGAGTYDYTYTKYETALLIPIGVGVKFKLSDALGLKVGYTENFMDGFGFTGDKVGYPAVYDHYSYGYAGLDYTFGTKSKPNLAWVNPVALMYDELYDAALRQEVEALKGRVANVEGAVNDLKKDSDGDGVADQFDKCKNTPANTVVDGSGCPIIFPKFSCDSCMTKPDTNAKAYSNIQFEFDSSVLKTSSYPILDATSKDLRAGSGTVTLAGYASSEGTAAHNLRLSRDRANSVKTYLVNSGVDAKRLKVKAYGEADPIANNSTEEGRSEP